MSLGQVVIKGVVATLGGGEHREGRDKDGEKSFFRDRGQSGWFFSNCPKDSFNPKGDKQRKYSCSNQNLNKFSIQDIYEE